MQPLRVNCERILECQAGERPESRGVRAQHAIDARRWKAQPLERSGRTWVRNPRPRGKQLVDRPLQPLLLVAVGRPDGQLGNRAIDSAPNEFGD